MLNKNRFGRCHILAEVSFFAVISAANHMEIREIEPYKNLQFIARQIVEGYMVGLHKSPFHGFSVEFSEHRLYNSGESTKNIDWKLYGRTDRLFVKRFEEETNLRCQIVLDTSSSMYFPANGHADFENPDKITFSAYASAVLIEILQRQRDAFGLAFLSDRIVFQSELRSSVTHQTYLLHHLDTLLKPYSPREDLRKATALSESLHLLAERTHKRSLFVIFTDAFMEKTEQERLFDALRHLRHNRHEVLLFHVFDGKKEVNLELGNRPYTLIDMETGRQLKLNPSEIAGKYRQLTLEHFENLKNHALQYGIDYVAADINQNFGQIMQPYLLKRKKMLI